MGASRPWMATSASHKKSKITAVLESAGAITRALELAREKSGCVVAQDIVRRAPGCRRVKFALGYPLEREVQRQPNCTLQIVVVIERKEVADGGRGLAPVRVVMSRREYMALVLYLDGDKARGSLYRVVSQSPTKRILRHIQRGFRWHLGHGKV